MNATIASDGTFSYTTSVLASGSQTITIKAVKGTTVVTQTATVTIPTANQAAVVSAEAINPREIKVVFSQDVEEVSAELAGNYTIEYDGGAETVVSATLQSDDKTVILTTTTEFADNKSYKVKKIENVVTEANNQKMAKYEGSSKLFSNTVGPKLLKVEKTVDNKFKLTFDKHVELGTASVKIDNVLLTVANPAGYTVPGTNPGTYTVTTNAINPAVPAEANLVKTGTHTAVVTGVQDVQTVANPVQQMSFSVSQDNVAPSVASVTPKGYNKFEITFSEPIYVGGVEAVNLDSLVTSNNLELKKGTFVYPYAAVGVGAANGFVSTAKVADKDYTYLIEVNPEVVPVPGGATYKLYEGGETSSQLSLTVKGYKDAAGFIGNLYSSTVTLNKESVKPYVLSSNLNKYVAGVGAGDDTMTIKFSEDLSTTATDIDTTKVSVYDKDNVKQVLDATAFTVSGDTMTIGFGTDPGTVTQQFKVVIESGAVKDLSGNANDALTTYVDNRAAATKLVMTSAAAAGHDALVNIGAGEIAVVSTAKNVITVNYGEKMDDNAILSANYKLDGAALPVGSKVDFVDANKSLVNITLPDGIYSTGATATLTLSKSITNDAGTKYAANASDDEATATVSLSDNVKPVLTGAKFVASESDTTTKAIELTFSEGLAAIVANTAGNEDDFVVMIGGAEYSVASIGKSIIADGTGAGNTTAGDTKVRIALSDAVNIGQSVQVKVVPVGTKNTAIDTLDTAKAADTTTAAGNKLTEGTIITVSGTVAP